MYNYEENSNKTSSLAVIGFITSIISFLAAGMLWIPSLILSICGLVRAKKNRMKGAGMAIAGIIISAVCIIECAFFILLVGAVQHTKKYADKAKDTQTRKLFEDTLDEDSDKISKSFGSYEISSDWTEASSGGPKTFYYCYKGNESESQPNNIMVKCDKYDFSEDEVTEFQRDLQAQLYQQAADSNCSLTGSGSTGKTGLPIFVYTFTSNDENDKTVSTQYYIMGDQQFVMVSAMVWDQEADEKEGTNECAKTIVDTFEWK